MSHVGSRTSPPDVTGILQSFQTPLRAFVAARVQSPFDVDDVLQEVFLRLAQSGEALHEVQHLAGWLHRVARNAIADHYRARGRLPQLVEEIPDTEDARAEERGSSADNRRELAACLCPLIERLPEPYREAIRLTEIDGLTQAEAARRAGISLSGMKSRVQRGREQLRAIVLACCEVDLDGRRGIARFESKPGGCDCKST